MPWEIFRQNVWEGKPRPDGDEWEPFAAACTMAADDETIWWKRKVSDTRPCDRCKGTGHLTCCYSVCGPGCETGCPGAPCFDCKGTGTTTKPKPAPLPGGGIKERRP